MEEYIPENNLVVLLLLIILTGTLYLFWWIARVSKIFNDDPVINIILTIFTCGIWFIYLLVKYMQKSEMMNGREMNWFLIIFVLVPFLIPPIIIQHNINEKLFPSR
jgi:hypothetical protein